MRLLIMFYLSDYIVFTLLNITLIVAVTDFSHGSYHKAVLSPHRDLCMVLIMWLISLQLANHLLCSYLETTVLTETTDNQVSDAGPGSPVLVVVTETSGQRQAIRVVQTLK